MYQVYSLQYILRNIIYSTGNEYYYEQYVLYVDVVLYIGYLANPS